MKSSKGSWVLALSVLAGFSFSASASSASTFQYDSYTVTNTQSIHILTPNNITGGMGQIVLHGAGANSGQFQAAWCLDIYDGLTNSGTYTAGPLTTAGSGGSNPILSAAQISEIGSLMVHGTALINSDKKVSAATQLAIWMVEYGNTFTYSGVSSTVTTLAQQYESNVMAGGQWVCPTCIVTMLSLRGDQNLGYGSDLPGGNFNLLVESNQGTTPLPAALPLFVGGLGGFGLLAWRRKRKV